MIYVLTYITDILRKFDLDNSKLASTPFEPQKIREKNVPDEPISVHLYRSMIGCLMYLTATRPDIMFVEINNWWSQFLGRRLISWQCKKQTIVATSSYEAEYVAAASCCGQWFLFTSAGRVTFCWLFPIPAGDLVSAGHMLFLLGSASEVSLPYGVRGLVATTDCTAYTVTEASIRIATHPSPDPMPSPPRQSSPPPIPFGPAPTSGLVFTEPIPDILFSFRPSELVLESIPSPFGDDDTGGGSFHESPPRLHPATLSLSPTVGVAEEPLTLTYLLALFPTCLQRIATLEAELKATKILHRDTVVLFAKRIKKLESKLKTKKRKLVLSDSENEEEARQSKELDALLDLGNASLHEPSLSTTLSKPTNPEQSLEQEISLTTLDAVLTLSQSKAKARAAKIIYKRPKKKNSSFGLDFTDVDIPAGGLDSADLSKGKEVATPSSLVIAPTDKELADQQAAILKADRQELLEQELNQSIDAEQVYLDSLFAQRVAEEQDKESMASEAQSTQRQAELDRVALNLSNEEWIGLVDQVWDNPTLSAELLGADVSKDTFSIRTVELMNRRRKVIADMKAKVKREKPMTPAQQKDFMRTFVKNQSSVIYSTGWTWKDVRGLTDDQLRIEYDKIRRAVDLATAKDQHQHLKSSAKLQETTSVSAYVPIAASDPIPAVTSVSADFSVSAASSNLAA
nr:ribonuclease H-like domain, reverse transcriptase, RNA-dependent DNA polymerase [Tanacetum cinerariifolium]